MSGPYQPGARALLLGVALSALGVLHPVPLFPAEPGPVLRAHRFEGRTWIPAPVLEAQLGLPPGVPVDDDAVRQAFERLIAFRYIETAAPPRAEAVDGGPAIDLIWPIRERRLARKVLVKVKPWGRGGAFSTQELSESLRTRQGQPVVAEELEEDRQAIRTRYVHAGYPLCEVVTDEREAGPGPGVVEVSFTVEEGPRAWLRAIEIHGNREIPESQILDVMVTRRRILFGLVSRGLFDAARFPEDVERVRDLYRERGYLEALVAGEPPLFSPDFQGVTAAIRVEEGPRYLLEEVRIRGNSRGVPAALLMKQVKTRPGGFYDGRSLEEDRRRLVRWYEEHYDRVPGIEIRREFLLDEGEYQVAAVFEIDESTHLQTGLVNVAGNIRTRDRVIRGALAVRPAAPLTEMAIERSGRSLVETGFFEPEKLRVTPQPGAAVRDVNVKVEEKRTGMVEVGGGVGSGTGEIAHFSVTQTNFDLFAIPGPNRSLQDSFSGGGQRLSLVFEPGTIESMLRLSFEEPYLYNSSHSLFVQAGGWRFSRESYDESGIGGEIILKRFWDQDHHFSTALAWIPEDVEISHLAGDAPPDVTAFKGHTFLSYPSLRLAYGDLDLNYWRGPTGFFAEARGDLASSATGSEVSFFRTAVRADLFQPVSEWIDAVLGDNVLSDDPRRLHVVRLGGRFGWSEGLEGDDIPFFERFYLGGPQSGTFHRAGAEGFRGFDYRGVGPDDNGTRIGGRAYYHLITEYSFPLLIPEFRAVALFEMADIEPEFARLSTGRLRTAAGAGLRIRMRVLGQSLPMDFYFVQALAKEPEDDDRFFTFTLGFGF